MTALRFFILRAYRSGKAHPVHTGDPDRLPHYTMCGVVLDSNFIAAADPHVTAARACARCAEWRELAEERAARARGIIGGWEVASPVADDLPFHGWNAKDSLGHLWIVYGNDAGGRVPSFVAAVAIDGRVRHVRKLGAKNRAKWKTDAIAMRACEDLARSGEYLLDRPSRGAA